MINNNYYQNNKKVIKLYKTKENLAFRIFKVSVKIRVKIGVYLTNECNIEL